MGIDEAGRDHQAGGIDDRRDLAVGHCGQVSDGRNPVARDADVGRATGLARSVDEKAAADEEIEAHRPRSYRAVAPGDRQIVIATLPRTSPASSRRMASGTPASG